MAAIVYIDYNPGNYSSGSSYQDSCAIGGSVTLRGLTYYRKGYSQIGWTLNANGTGAYYNLNATFSPTASQGTNITLYPRWYQNTTIHVVNSSGGLDLYKVYVVNSSGELEPYRVYVVNSSGELDFYY